MLKLQVEMRKIFMKSELVCNTHFETCIYPLRLLTCL